MDVPSCNTIRFSGEAKSGRKFMTSAIIFHSFHPTKRQSRKISQPLEPLLHKLWLCNDKAAFIYCCRLNDMRNCRVFIV